MATAQIEPTPPFAAAQEHWSRLLQRWTLALLLLGVLWRVTRYLLRFPFWGDEAFICLNMIDQGYLALTGQLQCNQVAPILFLWGELTAALTLGVSELAMRLVPFAAGMIGLLLFWRLAQRSLPPLACTLAVGFLAVAIWPVSMCTNIKPYSLDLCMSTLLMLLAVQWLHHPARLRWLVLLALAVPIALLTSYPTVFVAGSISFVLLPAVWRQPGWKARFWFGAYNALMLAAFSGSYLLVGVSQLDRTGGSVNSFLQTYWAHGFPPSHPLELISWLLMIHTSRLFAYPIGGDYGLCLPTFVVFLIGLVWLWRQQKRSLVLLCVGPFALGMVAAVLRKYPYGGCCRLSQHVAPIICLAAGTGVAALIGRLRSMVQQRQALHLAGGLLVAIGVGGMLIDVLYPYRGDCDLWARELIRDITSRCGPDDQIVVLNNEDEVEVVLHWELERFRLQGGLLGWRGKVDQERLQSTTTQLWVLKMPGAPHDFDVIPPMLERTYRTWYLTSQVPHTIVPRKKKDPPLHCEVCRWICTGSPHLPMDLAAVSYSP